MVSMSFWCIELHFTDGGGGGGWGNQQEKNIGRSNILILSSYIG